MPPKFARGNAGELCSLLVFCCATYGTVPNPSKTMIPKTSMIALFRKYHSRSRNNFSLTVPPVTQSEMLSRHEFAREAQRSLLGAFV